METHNLTFGDDGIPRTSKLLDGTRNLKGRKVAKQKLHRGRKRFCHYCVDETHFERTCRIRKRDSKKKSEIETKEMTEMKNEIRTMNDKMAEMKNEMGEMKSSMGAMTTEMLEVKDALIEAKASIEQAKDEISKTKIQKEIRNIEEKDELKKEMKKNSEQLNKRLTEVTNPIRILVEEMKMQMKNFIEKTQSLIANELLENDVLKKEKTVKEIQLMSLTEMLVKKQEKEKEDKEAQRKRKQARKLKVWKEMTIVENFANISDQEMVSELRIFWRMQRIWMEMEQCSTWTEVESKVRNRRDEEGQRLTDEFKNDWIKEMERIQKQKEEERKKKEEQEKSKAQERNKWEEHLFTRVVKMYLKGRAGPLDIFNVLTNEIPNDFQDLIDDHEQLIYALCNGNLYFVKRNYPQIFKEL